MSEQQNSGLMEVEFRGKKLTFPQKMTTSSAQIPNLMMSVSPDGQNALTTSTLAGFETFSPILNFEWEMHREVHYDSSSQLTTSAQVDLPPFVIGFISNSVSVDIINVLTQGIPFASITIAENRMRGSVVESREMTTFTNCQFVSFKKALLDLGDGNTNVTLAACRATSFQIDYVNVDQAAADAGTAAAAFDMTTGTSPLGGGGA